ncbi:MAG: aminodeoxychorismate synthase component I [Arcobacter sp.]|nr:MAG: aminodeoxychorismate synthase component I [Arcobacter sp.]
MKRLSKLASSNTPFLFYTNFDASQTYVYTLDALKDEDIEFSFEQKSYTKHSHFLVKYPQDFNTYEKGFNLIIEKIKSGETYLLNYTCETPIQTKLSLKEIFACANAAFKLRVKDAFLCFSPERFIKIQDNTIFTYPMKGTIDASIDNAEAKILANAKETAEHIMVVDLLRNDLSMVSKEVRVSKFRYIDKIRAGEKELLQVSSEIQGKLENDWKNNLGEILQKLLPAGSITGTPKKRTTEIIKETESYERDFFTGVFGYFDGEVFDSAVMIRFVEQKKNALVYKSGGGITLDSNAKDEYQEMLDKIYLP